MRYSDFVIFPILSFLAPFLKFKGAINVKGLAV